MKGIILAGGMGSRLYPATEIISKQLLPVYDKPMIYYPLSTLMLAGIRDILIISTERDMPLFQKLLGTGSNLGLKLEYKVQDAPNGLAEAFIIGQDFIQDSSVALILGDNIFYGQGLGRRLEQLPQDLTGCYLFGHYVKDPERYGVASFNESGEVIDLAEKPKNPLSNYAITGLYFYDNKVVEYAHQITPSTRGELEITDLNKHYLKNGTLKLEVLGRGVSWFDTGTHDSLLEASEFVSIIEKRQGLKISCPEEIAFRKEFINRDMLSEAITKYRNSTYGSYLQQILEEK